MDDREDIRGLVNHASVALAARRVSKTFPGVRALDNVSISFRRGAITALLGPNGCGKSTLIKILAGFHAPDGGSEIELWGEPLATPIDPRLAYARGLRFVHQDLGLVEEMSVADNLSFVHAYAGRSLLARIGRQALIERAREALERFGLDVSPETPVNTLSRTDQIMVGIARAFQSGAGEVGERVVVLDEPTASLPAESVERVLHAVARMRDHGGTIVYVTHRIDEVRRIADDVVVLRDGGVIAARELGDLDEHGLATLITGAVPKAVATWSRSRGDESEVLDARGISGKRLRDVSFTVHRGEILGVAGLAGCGRSELSRIAAGVQRPRAGEMRVAGKPVEFRDPRAAISEGIVFLPSARTLAGIADLSVRHNIALSDLSPFWNRGWLSRSRERSTVSALLEDFDVRPRDTERRLGYLSGGNQQKAAIAKLTRLKPKLLVVDEPTQGVDVSGKREIASVLRRLATGGCAVILASSDFDEVAGLCDRVLVLDRGEAIGVFEPDTITERGLALLANRERDSLKGA